MRTTVKLDEDVVAAVAMLRARHSLGFSEALNALARAGAASIDAQADRPRYVPKTFDLGITMDVSNVAEVIEQLESSRDR